MASNLSTIGFVFEDEDAFRAAMIACAGAAVDQLPCATGNYGIWRSRAGAEIWFHLAAATPDDDGENSIEICGLTPFFEGQSDVALKVTGVIARSGDNPFEGAVTGWVSPDEAGEGSYPIVFDAVDFAAHAGDSWPAIRHVRLAGFARELQAFASEEAYYAARGAPDVEQPKLAAHAFIPVGLFAATQNDKSSGSAPETPLPTALLTGTILEHQTFTNEASGLPFVWLLVESLEATIDIVADPAVINGELRDGGTIETAVWMFGRFLD